ncbi:MAG: glycerol kinase GlpK, partial [Fimbriimonadaceae bacterium]|nr:glycerol kinase GlpK [Chitinophagales bacterium]
IIFDENLNEVSKSQKEFTQIFPQPGWVEHNAEEIWETQLFTIQDAIHQAKIDVKNIAAIGITNQRETIVVWNKITGKPIYNAIVWQDRRTADICEELKSKGLENYIQQNTGLVIDAYFSGTKMKWILENIPEAKKLADENNLLCGTIDTWLIWKLTNGKVHATDYSNASRTLIYNIRNLNWDEKLLNALNIPKYILPEVKNSADNYGTTNLFGTEIPICGVAGDQQAALFGQKCFTKGSAKNTYGTGCFMLMNIGDEFISSKSKLLTTIAWGINNKIEYALEGSVFIAGAVIQWLRDQLQIISASEDTEKIAAALTDNGGVYFVPAFTGLGAPHWDMYARGIITGLTRGTNKDHIVRAALESIAYQTRDVFEAMQKDAGIKLEELKVDGGATANNWLMQFQSDILQTKVIRPAYLESTAMGAAMLAGIGAGLYKLNVFDTKKKDNQIYIPQMKETQSDELYAAWKNIIIRNFGFKKE